MAETQTLKTPADLAIRPRDIAFGRERLAPRWWQGGNPVATAFFNTLSASFPQGERFFMDAARRFREVADARLAGQIQGFLTQEAVHSREHLFFNNRLVDQGYDLRPVDTYLKNLFDFGRTLPPLKQLAATIALEHFTAILAHAILTDGEDLADAPAELRRMWQWHAIEEIEHKAVAFDTFMAATRQFSSLRRWWIRCSAMIVTTILFTRFILFGVRTFFRQDGIDNRRSWRMFRGYLWTRPGIFRRVAPAYFAYFKPGFHPWQVDDRALIADVEATLAAYRTAA